MSKITFGIILTLLTAGLLPFVFVARSRASRSDRSPIHLVLDMDNQPRFDPQAASPVFADQRSMRPKIEGTVAQEDMVVKSEILTDNDNPHLLGPDIDLTDPSIAAAVTLGRRRVHGTPDDKFDNLKPPASDAELAKDNTFYVRTIPNEVKVTPEFLRRGQERFNIYCMPCHGEAGYGDGMVNARAQLLMKVGGDNNGTAWTQPQNLIEPKIIDRPDGSIFNTITNGARTMPAYDKQITIMDRWAIVAYVRALQHSQHASQADAAAMAQTGK
jgi:mono/diheme cytochrome c family protein